VTGRASVEAVLGQIQLGRAAPQPHIQRPVWPEGVLRFDFEPELCVPVNALPASQLRARSGRYPPSLPLAELAPLASWDRWHGTPSHRHKTMRGKPSVIRTRDLLHRRAFGRHA
jgi:hypothetical protein